MALFARRKDRDAFRKHLAKQCLKIFKSMAPVDTGFLRSSIIIEENELGFDIVVNVPYTVYTNEKWISPNWNGKNNPNENWFNHAYKMALGYVSSEIVIKTTLRKHGLGDDKYEIIKKGKLTDFGQEAMNYAGEVSKNSLPNAIRSQTVQEYIDNRYGKGF